MVSPLFSAFGLEPIATRVNLGAGKVLVTTDALYERKIAKWRDSMPTLQHICWWRRTAGVRRFPEHSIWRACSMRLLPNWRWTPGRHVLLHFTSGTTGTPKGAIHVHGAVVTHWSTGRYALDLQRRHLLNAPPTQAG